MLSSWGVVGALPMTNWPCSSTTITSVIVPPASHATRYRGIAGLTSFQHDGEPSSDEGGGWLAGYWCLSSPPLTTRKTSGYLCITLRSVPSSSAPERLEEIIR